MKRSTERRHERRKKGQGGGRSQKIKKNGREKLSEDTQSGGAEQPVDPKMQMPEPEPYLP